MQLMDWRASLNARPNPSFFSLCKRFTRFKKEVLWLKEYSATITRHPLKHIDETYKGFWKQQGGLPKFHAKWHSDPSFSLPTGTFKLQGDWLHIQKIGQVRLIGNNPYEGGKPVSGTVKYEGENWYAYLVYEVEVAEADGEAMAIGIDRNVGQITLSDGTRYDLPNTDRLEARRRRYQRMMARRQGPSRKLKRKPSHRYLIARGRARKTSMAIAQARTNWCHRVSRGIADRYAKVYLEDLNIKGMTKSAKGTTESPGKNVKQKTGLNRSINASAWGKLEQCLSYKAEVVKVPAAYTSQTCNACGWVHADNRKTQADFKCLACGHRANADVNAALNILASGNGAAARGGRDAGKALSDTGIVGL